MLSNIDKAFKELFYEVNNKNAIRDMILSDPTESSLSLKYNDIQVSETSWENYISGFHCFYVFGRQFTIAIRKDITEVKNISFIYNGEIIDAYILPPNSKSISIITVVMSIITKIKRYQSLDNKVNTLDIILDYCPYILIASIYTTIYDDTRESDIIELIEDACNIITKEYNKNALQIKYETPDIKYMMQVIKYYGVKLLLDNSKILECDFVKKFAEKARKETALGCDLFGP